MSTQRLERTVERQLGESTALDVGGESTQLNLTDAYNYMIQLPEGRSDEDILEALNKLGLDNDELSEWTSRSTQSLYHQPEYRTMLLECIAGGMPPDAAALGIGLKFGVMTGVAFKQLQIQELSDIVGGFESAD